MYRLPRNSKMIRSYFAEIAGMFLKVFQNESTNILPPGAHSRHMQPDPLYLSTSDLILTTLWNNIVNYKNLIVNPMNKRSDR
jgi:hypothetical protein